MAYQFQQIVSGGQTGVDRAALDVAIHLQIPHGGWCPRGRLAEDGPIAACYQLRETAEPEYAVRTERNVIDSQGTLVLHFHDLTGGTKLTVQLADRYRRPRLLVDLAERMDPERVVAWLIANRIAVLNVAGPRESSVRGIGRLAEEFLCQVFGAPSNASRLGLDPSPFEESLDDESR